MVLENRFRQALAGGLLTVSLAWPNSARVQAALTASTVAIVPSQERSPLYVCDRAPLLTSPLIELPIGSITPRGWLRHQLELEAEGMTGHLEELSKWCQFRGNAWTSPDGRGQNGWEEVPYWLKGFGDLGYVLQDQRIIREARRWIDAVLASREPDGWFGPRSLKTSLKGKPDLWPHMVMCNVLQSYYDYSGDVRALEVLTGYFKWLNALPAADFGNGYWLYNRTGDAFLLELARRIHDHMARWDSGVINWHNVNVAQGFREPGVFYLQAKDPKYLQDAERNYETVMDRYGQFPGGTFVADENARPGYVDPRGGFETCGIVEFMHSFEMLTKISGDPVWADRCEDIAFNSFPCALTPDLKGLHYLTCANQVQLDRYNKSPDVQNGGTMFSYSPFGVYRCCQHNVSHGWPYYAEELWLATADRGLCASLYAASQVKAKVGDGTLVTITEDTHYPFNDTVRLRLAPGKPVAFPLYLRVPRWCKGASVKVNGHSVPAEPRPLAFLVLNRTWNPGDTVTLHLPMRVEVRKWAKNKGAVSVNYGPLSFALDIQEKWERYGSNPEWPEWQVFPDSPWNYGLVLNRTAPAKSFTLVRRTGPLATQPFTPQTAPLALEVRARRIPGWTMDRFHVVGKLQQSPVHSDQPLETIRLIPMGAARLRISMFPTIGRGSAAHAWVAPPGPRPPAYRASASHCFENDTVDALSDGLVPANSNDHGIPRFTWWDHRGTTEWIQYRFDRPRTVSAVAVYWFDDTGTGQCRVPASWNLLYRVDDAWRPVAGASAFGTQRDGFNQVTFTPVETPGLRIVARLQPGFSGGVLEWKVGG
jgi:Beta-L-arabinofuranosidase, GH127 catalytic domain/Beta-L-arabinofuranosidase, GH127 middle domain